MLYFQIWRYIVIWISYMLIWPCRVRSRHFSYLLTYDHSYVSKSDHIWKKNQEMLIFRDSVLVLKTVQYIFIRIIKCVFFVFNVTERWNRGVLPKYTRFRERKMVARRRMDAACKIVRRYCGRCCITQRSESIRLQRSWLQISELRKSRSMPCSPSASTSSRWNDCESLTWKQVRRTRRRHVKLRSGVESLNRFLAHNHPLNPSALSD